MTRKRLLYLVFSAALGLSVDIPHFFASLLPAASPQVASKAAAAEIAVPAYDSTLGD